MMPFGFGGGRREGKTRRFLLTKLFGFRLRRLCMGRKGGEHSILFLCAQHQPRSRMVATTAKNKGTFQFMGKEPEWGRRRKEEREKTASLGRVSFSSDPSSSSSSSSTSIQRHSILSNNGKKGRKEDERRYKTATELHTTSAEVRASLFHFHCRQEGAACLLMNSIMGGHRRWRNGLRGMAFTAFSIKNNFQEVQYIPFNV